ncbi:MAG: RIP metalloprotease RseP [gamma proteobacterium symbiont of Bathyaustriella thionipta]|nr:RIP metalloprotease RseP [gamma proteobacterium symbiont of Bathyaustriella thionipta]
MPDFLFYPLAFISALGILIALHEYGHFWVAKRLGVKVLRYSIGFGKALIKWTGKRDGVEYVIAAIPLGGYVKMLDEREAEVDEKERHLAFNNQSLWVRSAIVAAGPVANLLFAVLAYWAVFWIGQDGFRPIVGEVQAESAAAIAGFHSEDEIISINGRDVPTWEATLFALLAAADDEAGEVSINVHSKQGGTGYLKLDKALISRSVDNARLLEGLGIEPFLPVIKPLLGEVVEGQAAQKAGLQSGDLVLAVNEVSVADWRTFVHEIQKYPNLEIALQIQRDGHVQNLHALLGGKSEKGKTVGYLGVGPQRPDRSDFVRFYSMDALPALAAAFRKTGEVSWMTLRMMGRMLTGKASIQHLSGPISIAKYAGASANMGAIHFLGFLAIVSISLGIINLFPLPILDGGHLLFFAIEAIRGKPLSEDAELFGQKIGIALLVTLMTVAFYVDIGRLFE